MLVSRFHDYGFRLGKPQGDTEEDSAIWKAAQISDDKLYRYFLVRYWGSRDPNHIPRILIFVMLNPSTADAVVDDPTIRRCMGFARREGYDGVLVVNLFAYRSAKPEIMRSAQNPIGPENDQWLIRAFQYAREFKIDVIAAWGAHGQFEDRDMKVAKLACRYGVQMKCLGKTDAGDPRHPLYIKADKVFEPLMSDEMIRELEAA